MSNKNKSATPTVQQPSQGTNTAQGVQDNAAAAGADAPVTSASAGNEASADDLAGASGSLVTDTASKTGEVTSVAAVAAVATAKAEAAAPSVFSAEVQGYLDELQSSAARNGFAQVAEYLRKMAPGQAWEESGVAGAAEQVQFYRAVQSLLEVQGPEFRVAFGVLLRVFLDNVKGALGGAYLYRFTGQMNLPKNDREGFLRLMGMLERLADPKTREIQSKTFDFNTQLRYGISDGARRNILTYFNK